MIVMASFLTNLLAVGPKIKQKGKAIFEEGKVELLAKEGKEAKFKVHGSKDYEVVMHLEDMVLTSYSCTCSNIGLCKHVASCLYFLNQKRKEEIEEEEKNRPSLYSSYLAYYEDSYQKQQPPLLYEAKKRGISSFSKEELDEVITKGLALTLRFSHSLENHFIYTETLYKMAKLKEEEVGPIYLEKALATLKEVQYQPLLRLFLDKNVALGKAYQEAALPHMNHLLLHDYTTFGITTIKEEEARRILSPLLPYLAKGQSASAKEFLYEARVRKLKKESVDIFRILMEEQHFFDLDAFSYFSTFLSEEEKEALALRYLSLAPSFEDYLKARKFVSKELVQEHEEEIFSHARECHYEEALLLMEKGKEVSLTSFPYIDLARVLPYLEGDALKEAEKTIYNYLDSLFQKEGEDTSFAFLPIFLVLEEENSPFLENCISLPDIEKKREEYPDLDAILVRFFLKREKAKEEGVFSYGRGHYVS